MPQSSAEWLIEKYGSVVEAIAATFGPDCEVVLHDLTRPMTSVVKVCNGHVTGRMVGTAINHLISTVIRSQRFKNDMLANYRNEAGDGRLIKSSTALIRDDQGQLVGALCINFSLERFQVSRNLLEQFLQVEELEPESEAAGEGDRPDDDVWGILTTIIRRVIESEGPVASMDKRQKVAVVRFLDEKGVFLIKGAVDEVARHLNVSRYSVYNYIDEARGAARHLPEE